MSKPPRLPALQKRSVEKHNKLKHVSQTTALTSSSPPLLSIKAPGLVSGDPVAGVAPLVRVAMFVTVLRVSVALRGGFGVSC